MLEHFTNGDPDGNGVKDTYGLTFCKYEGPIEVITTWFGGGNQWVEANGKYEPYMFTQGYMDAMNKMKEWYQKGYINEDFAVRDTSSAPSKTEPKPVSSLAHVFCLVFAY
jgi:putative aldouronate transport system substrate-binding protein